MLKEKFVPVKALEEAVLAKDNALILRLIAQGAELDRPDVLATQEAFDLNYNAALLLLDSSPCLKKDEVPALLEKLGANSEMVELVRELQLPLPLHDAPQSTEFIDALKADEPEKFTDECLADLIIDRELGFDVRPFKDFAPYYQALMRNHAGVNLDQFDEEAEIEKFDAKAVFELLSGTYEYDDRINWELVNKTAKASEWLEFLAKFPQYADKADWQMINVQADAKDWFDFLEQQPELLRKCRDHKMLYLAAPERWQQITENSGFRFGTCFAFLCQIENEWIQLFKVLIRDGKATFSEVSDLDTYQEFSDMAQKDFQAFCGKLQSFEEADRFVNIIR
jgi:hypothetical protein